MTGRGLAVLGPGDEIRLGGRVQIVVALDGTSVRLVDVTGSASIVLVGHLLADPSFELLTGRRPSLPALGTLERLPAEVLAAARWWERHLVEVLTGVPPDAITDLLLPRFEGVSREQLATDVRSFLDDLEELGVIVPADE